LFFPRFKNQANEQMEGPVDNSIIQSLLKGDLGVTGANEYLNQVAAQYTGPTGPSSTILAMFPSAATGPTGPQHIATLDELMSSYSAVVTQEQNDIINLSVLKNPSREGFRNQLFQWAAAKFPDLYVVQSIDVNPPTICSDGVTRNLGKYIEYCLGTDMGTIIQEIAALLIGINPTWSTDGNTLRIHVTKAS